MKRGSVLWAFAFVAVVIFVVAPATRNPLISATRAHPLVMGFIKFAILASLGELLGLRITAGEWKKPIGLRWRVLVWGVLGALIAFMFVVFNAGAQAAIAAGMLPCGSGSIKTIATAFWISTVMNVTFAPVMMIGHRMSDTYLDLCGGRIFGKGIRFCELASHIDWHSLFGFVIGKTIPFLWIPAHTLTFLAPAEYRVLITALLSIVFGVILAAAKSKKKPAQVGMPVPENATA